MAKDIAKAKKQTRGARVTEDNWDDLLHPRVREAAREAETAQPAIADAANGMVIGVASARCRVFMDGREVDVVVPPDIAVQQKSLLAVGDQVFVEEEGGLLHLRSVMPRRSVLARPDPLNPHLQRLIAANIDVVIHVVSVKAPPLRPRLIDRFMIAIQRGGAQPVLAVNKIDLLDAQERETEMAKLTGYRDLGLPMVECSTKSGEGLDALRSLVQGKTAALVGHSGVGKSSILNALDSRLQLATNALHRRGTGRHTTSTSTLYDFGDGTYLIDTPGIREFGLWDLDRHSLRDYFPEFEEAAELCRFTDCTHIHEPDCEVKERVESGTLNRARYDTYARLYDSLQK
jgi:ribosome biogenesis GTPase / thiamine phosphate phosphatase